jgi:hypothetical protein
VCSDCGPCEYCEGGRCVEAPGCCEVVPGLNGELEVRCGGYECSYDGECDDGEECDDGVCWEMPPISACELQALTLSAIPLQGAPSAVALADVDGDGALDLLAALGEQGEVEVRLGDGAGGFAPGATFPTALAPGAQRLVVADFNGDGWADLALTRAAPVGELSLLFGQDAMFAAPVKETLGHLPVEVFAGDFDGDGQVDLLARGESVEAPIALRLGDGLGGFGPEIGLAGVSEAPPAVAVGALAGAPGRLDVAVTRPDGPGVDVLELARGPEFAVVASLTAMGSAPSTSVVTGDVDGDGQVDVVALRAPGGRQLVQTWSQGQALPLRLVPGELQPGPVADVNGDGAGDLVALGDGTLRVVFVFGEPCVQTVSLAEATAPSLLAAGDVDGDGKADVIAGAAGQASATLLRTGP